MPPAPTAPFECLPPELLSYILSFVGADVTRCTSSKHVPDYRPLLATSLVARDWSYPSQELLFSTVHLLNGKLRARRKWTECKVEPGKFATRVLVVGGGAWDENAEQLQTMVEKCTRLRTLEIGGHGHISTSLFGSPALSRELPLNPQRLVCTTNVTHAFRNQISSRSHWMERDTGIASRRLCPSPSPSPRSSSQSRTAWTHPYPSSSAAAAIHLPFSS